MTSITYSQNEVFVTKHNEVMLAVYGAEVKNIIDKVSSEEYFLYISWRAEVFKIFSLIQNFQRNKDIIKFFLENSQKGTMTTTIGAFKAIFPNALIEIIRTAPGELQANVELFSVNATAIVDGTNDNIVDGGGDLIVALERTVEYFAVLKVIIESVVKNGTKIILNIT